MSISSTSVVFMLTFLFHPLHRLFRFQTSLFLSVNAPLNRENNTDLCHISPDDSFRMNVARAPVNAEFAEILYDINSYTSDFSGCISFLICL